MGGKQRQNHSSVPLHSYMTSKTSVLPMDTLMLDMAHKQELDGEPVSGYVHFIKYMVFYPSFQGILLENDNSVQKPISKRRSLMPFFRQNHEEFVTKTL